MKMEHVALNVAEPVAMAAWYCQHLGFTVAFALTEPPYTHFLADEGGTVLLEIYLNPPGDVPDYAQLDPLLFHVAFVSEDPGADMQVLIDAGATLVQDQHLEDGSHLIMLRDPWGLAIQLCKRAVPMLKG